jgi:hypothetical protein
MVAPELGYIPVTNLLGAPDHTGSAVPVLLTWLIADRCRHPGRYWIGPAAVCVILGFSYTADSIVLLTGIVPLFAACAVRVPRKRAEPRWYELGWACCLTGRCGNWAATSGRGSPRTSSRSASLAVPWW